VGKQIILTEGAPAPVGPYAQAVRVGELIFVSGQIPLDPSTGAMITGDVTAQTRRVMDNLDAVLKMAGSSFDQVVKATVYLLDLGEFAAMNATYATYFGHEPPARATVQVAALPRGARVEIDLIAHLGA
jgi:2-iminobutanoate/2-iminopropanoate deaminase